MQGGKSLRPQDLERNGVYSPEAIFQLIYGGKGKMPGYGQSCAPKVSLACHATTLQDSMLLWLPIKYCAQVSTRMFLYL